MDEGRVSAIVPIKNGSAYILSSIPRILENLQREDELIVVDDSSTDGSRHLVLEACNSDPRLRIFSNPGYGIVDALNYGLKQARFELIARFDIDDIYEVDRLSKQRAVMVGNTVAVFCDYNIVDSEANFLGTIFSPVVAPATRLSLSQSQRTPHPGVLFSKSACFAVGGYRKGDEGVEDLSLWLRMAEVGDLISVPEVLFAYRIHKNSVTHSRRSTILEMKSRLMLEFPISSEELSEIRSKIGQVFMQYLSLPGTYRRIVLLSRELLLVGTFKQRLFNMFCLARNFLTLNPLRIVNAAYLIWFESKRRRRSRAI